MSWLKGHYLIYSLIRLDDKKYKSRSLLDRKLGLQAAGLYLPLYLLKKPADWNIWSQYKSLLIGTLPPPHQYMGHASVQTDPTRLRYGNAEWSFSGDPAADFRLKVTDKAFRISLEYRPVKPVTAVDEYGKLNGLRYYSVTRNEVSGQLHTADMSETLYGEGWFDHQWGRNYGRLQGTGWVWFGLQLEDGRDLLISRLQPAGSDSPASPVSKLIGRNGGVVTTEHVTMKPLKHWKSLHSKISYPVEWHILLPEFSMELHVVPLLNHQEIPIFGPLHAIWEGACTVTGESRSPQGSRTAIRGKGFMELVGYAGRRNAD